MGKTIFSMLLPPDLFVETGDLRDENEWNDHSLPVVVRQGRLCCGLIRKAHVGTSLGHRRRTVQEYRGVACMRFMWRCPATDPRLLLQKGHHVGIDDVMLSHEGHSRVNERIAKATRLCEEIQKQVIDAPSDIAAVAEGGILRLLSRCCCRQEVSSTNT